MTDYRQVFESGIHMLPQAITTCREAGISDEEFLKLCADLGKYFTSVSKLKDADELPALLMQKRMRALDGRIIKGAVSIFERMEGVESGLDSSGVPEEPEEPEEVVEQMVSSFANPAAVQEVKPPVTITPVPTMSFAQAVVGDKMKEYIAQVRGQA